MAKITNYSNPSNGMRLLVPPKKAPLSRGFGLFAWFILFLTVSGAIASLGSGNPLSNLRQQIAPNLIGIYVGHYLYILYIFVKLTIIITV